MATRSKGLWFVRLMMVLSSFTPLFILWAIRGMRHIPDTVLIVVCIALVIVPNLVLGLRFLIAKRRHDVYSFAVDSSEDHREHLLVYLFATLIPLYDANVGEARDGYATLTALAFIVFLFMHLNLHYVNVLFAIFGYRVFTVRTLGGSEPIVLLSKQLSIATAKNVQAYRLSNTVFIER